MSTWRIRNISNMSFRR